MRAARAWYSPWLLASPVKSWPSRCRRPPTQRSIVATSRHHCRIYYVCTTCGSQPMIVKDRGPGGYWSWVVGVRYVQIYSGGAHNDDNWDAHGDLVKNHEMHAGETDKPIAALLRDLKQRGLLDSTLIVWGGEFGRQPTAEYAKGTGRDHNAYGFTMWLAGGGIKGGASVGETDDIGSAAVTDRFHVKHLHATILHQLGVDA